MKTNVDFNEIYSQINKIENMYESVSHEFHPNMAIPVSSME